jgi:hypothetical protein
MFFVGPAAVAIYSSGILCSNNTCNSAQTLAALQSLKADTITLLGFPGKTTQLF